jgi:transcriptional regulator with GAF, ATPase, and Fis domain
MVVMSFELKITSAGATCTVLLDTGARWRIGRASACEVRITDPYVSAEHAELSLEGDGSLLLKKTGGANPVLVDGKPVERVRLHDGSRFTIGHSEFVVHAAVPAATPEPSTLSSMTKMIDTRAVLAGAPQPSPPAAEGGVEITPSVESATAGAPASHAHLLGQVCALLRQARDRQTLDLGVVDLACKRLGATRGMLAKVDGPGQIDVVMARGFPEGATIASLISKAVLQKILDERQAVIIGDTAAPDAGIGDQSSIVRNSIRAVACTPIFGSREELTGLLYVDNQNREAHFSTAEVEFLVWVGQVYSVLAENMEMRRRLEAEVVILTRTAGQAQIIAEAPAMMQLLERATKAAGSDAAALILGESGVGKECIARLLHQQSPRAGKPFRGINCGAITESLFESELFGHKKGSFTGATNDRLGLFREADGGTLFLDEIGDLNLEGQKKLLRAIQENCVRPVGWDRDVPVNVRLICATNKNLADAIHAKTFREDLYYRIGTVTLKVPPLRERREDIVLLARYFTKQCSDGARALSAAAEVRLQAYDWPGNVRELRAVIQQAVIYAGGCEIQADELDLPASSAGRVVLGPKSLVEVERNHILQVLREVGGNKTEAAKVLGISRSTLILKLKSYGREAD